MFNWNINNIFCGLLKCPDCGYTLGLARNHRTWNDDDYNANFDFYCNSYRKDGIKGCTKHRITAQKLYDSILEDIQRLAKEAIRDDDKMISSIAAKLGKAEKNGVKQAERE